VLAVLFAAKHGTARNDVRIYAAMEDGPSLHLEYLRAEMTDPPAEFLPLLSCAASRGVFMDMVCPIADPCRVQVRVPLGVAELSAQGVRERHRFLEGKSPLCLLVQNAAIRAPFPELLLD
jgi:hypothetical protein